MVIREIFLFNFAVLLQSKISTKVVWDHLFWINIHAVRLRDLRKTTLTKVINGMKHLADGFCEINIKVRKRRNRRNWKSVIFLKTKECEIV